MIGGGGVPVEIKKSFAYRIMGIKKVPPYNL